MAPAPGRIAGLVLAVTGAIVAWLVISDHGADIAYAWVIPPIGVMVVGASLALARRWAWYVATPVAAGATGVGTWLILAVRGIGVTLFAILLLLIPGLAALILLSTPATLRWSRGAR